MTQVFAARGFLFVGGLSLSSRPPLWRNDDLFYEKIVAKLASALEIAKEEKLVPVIAGSVFGRAREGNDALKTVLVRLLNGAWTRVFCGVGKNDKGGAELGDGDSLSLIGEAGALHIAAGGRIEAIAVDGDFRLGLGFSNYGDAMPEEVGAYRPEGANLTGVVWVHHRSKNGEQPTVVPGCNLVLDASAPYETPPTLCRGEDGRNTVWQATGLLARIYEDMAEFAPSAWSLTKEGLVRKPLPCEALTIARNVVDGEVLSSAPGAGGSFARALISIRQDGTKAIDPTRALTMVQKHLGEEGQALFGHVEKIYQKVVSEEKARK